MAKQYIQDGTTLFEVEDTRKNIAVIPTGVQAARVTLWEGEYNTANNSLNTFTNTVALGDSIENYDKLEITSNIYKTSSENNFVTDSFNMSDITYNKACIRISYSAGSAIASFLCSFADATHFAICFNDSSGGYVDAKITKITGIKYIQPDSYSTEEKLIGTWIDGKPLYRKVFDNPTNGMNIGLTNFEVIKIYGMYHDTVNRTYIRIPFSGNFKCDVFLDETAVLTIQSSSPLSNNISWIAVEYTKN